MTMLKNFLLDDIQKLRKEIEYWKKLYHQEKDLNERMSLDLGIKNQDFFIIKENTNEEENKQGTKDSGSVSQR